MKTIIVCLVFALVLSEVTSVTPVFPLDSFDPSTACLFMCSMCFDDVNDKYTDFLLECSNIVCKPGIGCHTLGLVWLGLNCKFPAVINGSIPFGPNPPAKDQQQQAAV